MLAIIDGDVLCYIACKPRWEKKAHIENGVSYRYLDDDGNPIPLEYTPAEDASYLEESWENLKKNLKDVLDILFCDEYVMAVKGPGNFRNYLFPEYKMNRHRDPSKANKFVPVLRKWSVEELNAVEAEGCEADDLMCIWAHECMKFGIPYVICSIDKDLRCIPGRHFDLKKNIYFDVSPQEAKYNYYCQLLKGDPTDNVTGVPGIGEVKAKKLLTGCITDEEFQETIVMQYYAVYGESWYEQILVNGRMIHLKKHHDDCFRVNDWPVVQFLQGSKIVEEKPQVVVNEIYGNNTITGLAIDPSTIVIKKKQA
jgi:hypothetical protein